MDTNKILKLIDLIGNSDYKLIVYNIDELTIYSTDGNNTILYSPHSNDQWQDCIDWLNNGY